MNHMTMRSAIAMLTVCAITALAAQDGVVIHNGFLTGDEFRKSTPSQQQTYVMGFVDGLLISPLVGAEKGQVKWLEVLIEGMTSEQITAILLKYINDNPEAWNECSHTIAYRALRQAYEKKYETIKK